VPEPDCKQIIAEWINSKFHTIFTGNDVISMHRGDYDEQEFDGFAISVEFEEKKEVFHE
jgi:hypothetical protein